MRMLVRQSKYSNLKYIVDNDNNEDYGYFYDLDISDKIIIENIPLTCNSHNNISNNINRHYVYNYIDQNKDDDIENNENNENNEILEKYNDLYFVINIIFITASGIILLYFVFTM